MLAYALCLTRKVLHTKVNAQYDELAKIVRQTSTVASIVNLVWLTTDAIYAPCSKNVNLSIFWISLKNDRF